MTNNSFKSYANSFQAIARLRLESIECLLNHLGNPQNDLKFIHIAGTNGKGSVCSFLQCIFQDAGYLTGKYTSPNLISVCERISVDGENIPQNELDDVLAKVEKGVRLVEKDLGEAPTQFEIWTAAAFLYFKARKCDIVILETGLGGTRDATNIIPPPLASVICRLDLDHTEYLGNTIEEIAGEKAGIIKKHQEGKEGLCVSARQYSKAAEVLKKACTERYNRFVETGEVTLTGNNGFFESFDYTSAEGVELRGISCGISGFYQPENAAIAAETALCLGVAPEFIKSGISRAKNPARFEIIRENPTVIYDGAHNKNGICALVTCLKRYFPKWQGAGFVMAFMGDKDIDGAFEELKNSGLMERSKVYAVQVKDNPRAAFPEDICKVANAHGIEAVPFDNLKQAYDAALSENPLTILCGSLYLYKDFDEIRDLG